MTAAMIFLIVAIGLVAVMTAAWALVANGAKSGWVDAFWSFAVGGAGVTVALADVQGWALDPVRSGIVAAVAALWSLRLGLHILSRTRSGGEDPRYAALKEEWGSAWRGRLFLFLQIQAAAALLLATTIFLAAHNPAAGLQWSDFAGLAILAVGVAGEGRADAQLARFRADPANRGKVCDEGLWAMTRHPNYFFQWLGWNGYAVMAIGPDGSWLWGWAALAGPVFMYWLLAHVSGVPPLEEHMLRSRGDLFRAYQRRVNAFWPGPQREEPVR